MAMQRANVVIRGIAPLMMHGDRLANPLDEWAIKLKSVTTKKDKTTEDYDAMSQIEFYGGIYHNGKTPFIPSRNFRKAIEVGATGLKKGADIKRGVFILEDELPLIYDGPKDVAGLFRSKVFVDLRMVGNQRNRVLRTRPIFKPPWGFEVALNFDAAEINEDVLRACVERAGQFVGLGDYRPFPSGGSYGRFAIESWD